MTTKGSSNNNFGIRPPIHPRWLRCSSVEYVNVFALLAPCQRGASASSVRSTYYWSSPRALIAMKRRLLCSLMLVLASGSPTTASAEPAPRSAVRAFAEGRRLFKERKYVKAVLAFKRAYEAQPHFMVQCSIARCYENMGKVVLAARHYRRCLAEGASETKKAKKVIASLQSAEERFTWLMINSPGAGGTIFVDGEELGPTPRRIPVDPGQHVVEVRRPPAAPAKESLSTPGGEELTLTLVPTSLAQPAPEKPALPPSAVSTDASDKPQPAPSRRRLPQHWFWTVTGTTVALGAVGIALGVLTLNARSAYEADPTESGYNKFTNMRLATNIVWGATAAAGISGTVLFFYTDFGGKRERQRGGKRGAMFSVGLRGSF
jgi:hypothetical protein